MHIAPGVRRGRPRGRAARRGGRCSSRWTTTGGSPTWLPRSCAGIFVKDADPQIVEDLRERGRAAARRGLRAHATRSAGDAGRRSSTTRARRGTSARPQVKDRLLEVNEEVDWYPEHISTAATATGSRTTSTGRCPASGTGARRCRSGAAARRPPARRSARSTSWASCAGRDVTDVDPHRPAIDEVTFACPECGEEAPARPRGDRHLVRLGRDAVRAVGLPPGPRPRAREFAAALPRRLHLRGDRPDARVVLHADGRGGAAVRRDRLPQRRLPRAHRGRGRTEDVEVPRQHRSTRGRRSTARAPTRCAGSCSRPARRGRPGGSATRCSTRSSASSC